MRSLLVAAALGLGLLSAGATVDAAAAAPFGDRPRVDIADTFTPLHYQPRGYHQPRYTPPHHHWRHHAPPRHVHGWRHQRSHQYGSRY